MVYSKGPFMPLPPVGRNKTVISKQQTTILTQKLHKGLRGQFLFNKYLLAPTGYQAHDTEMNKKRH